MRPIVADFTTAVGLSTGTTVDLRGCARAAAHLSLSAGGSVSLDFTVREWPADGLSVTVMAAPAALQEPERTMAMVEVAVNGRAVTRQAVSAEPVATPRDMVFAVPGKLLRAGANTVRLGNSEGPYPVLRLLRIVLAPATQG
ncbi:hypothetical protein ACFYWY_36915 [Streptomyces sp. NPDC002870]|uniref:hypothetical protein n=1 Tax=Streptomyces sp. NPDC002870 TaxID=3364666 RepID=UPI0036C3609E